MNDLSAVLWRQRELLALLLFKLESEQLLLAAGRTRWLAHANREIDTMLTDLGAVELTRAVEASVVARELRLPSDASLATIAAHAPEPWDDLFLAHRADLIALASEVDAAVGTNRDLLRRGYDAVIARLEAELAAPRVTVSGAGS